MAHTDSLRWTRVACIALTGTCSALLGLNGIAAQPGLGSAIGNRAASDTCAPCHREIVERFARTAMARTSGPAAGHIIQGSFVHARSGVEFAIRDEADGPVLAFSRLADPAVHGTLPLTYYVGSNTRGRTFLFRIDGFLYQSPVNYYARRGVWDMSPGYQSLSEMELNHPVDSSCLFCHASEVQRPVAGTSNRFEAEPFLTAGVGCERCHGPGETHAATGAGGPIVNPARLDPERRDAVCQQCHLEGRARIPRAGRSLLDYRPGDRLTDLVSTFVVEGTADGPLGAVSQVEALAASRCKRASGDRMSCLSCHDPHGDPVGASRGEYFRSRCVACHGALAAGHHSDTRDCTSCHMPRRDSADIAHTAVTDHRILERPGPASSPLVREMPLIEFGHTKATDSRELGLAYAELAGGGNQEAAAEATRLLTDTARRLPADPDVLAELGYLEQRAGRVGLAEDAYHRALASRPSSLTAAANLGVIEAGRGNLAAAITLWAPLYEANPQLSDLGLNLAAAECAGGQLEAARRTLTRLLRHDPDRRHAREMARALTGEPPTCLGPASGSAP